MNEAEVRSLVRREILGVLQVVVESAGWYADSHDDATRSAAWLVQRVMGMAISDLIPEPEPAPEPCRHAYATNVKGHSLCQLCGERLPSATEPVNPFAPKNTARQWADMIANLCRLAQEDGHTTNFDADGSVSGYAYLALTVGEEGAVAISVNDDRKNQ